MNWWACILYLCLSTPLWAREATIVTRDGKTYSGQVQLSSNYVVIANAAQDLRTAIPLTNLLSAQFAAATPSLPAIVPIAPAPPSDPDSLALPPPWSGDDIGNIDQLGSSRTTHGVFHVTSYGTNILGEADSCYFIFQPVKGDTELVVRVLQVRGNAPAAKAGLMLRQNLQSDSAELFLGARQFGSGVLTVRGSAGAAATETILPGLCAPCWLKLKRYGNQFSAYASRSGTQWRLLRRIELPMGEGFYAGLAVTGVRLPPANSSVRYARVPTRASFDNLLEAPFLASSFITRIELQNGSTINDRIAWADSTDLHFPGGAFGPEPLPAHSVSSILFQWLPSRFQHLLKEGRPGVILSTGEFIEGDFRGIAGNRVQISSVLQGLGSYDLGNDVLAVVLRKPSAATPAFEIQTEDGRVWYGQDVALRDGDVLIDQAPLGVRKVPIYELRAIRRMAG